MSSKGMRHVQLTSAAIPSGLPRTGPGQALNPWVPGLGRQPRNVQPCCGERQRGILLLGYQALERVGRLGPAGILVVVPFAVNLAHLAFGQLPAVSARPVHGEGDHYPDASWTQTTYTFKCLV